MIPSEGSVSVRPNPRRARRARRPYVTESERILDRMDAHEKAHGCTVSTCHIANGLQSAWWEMREAEAPLRVLFEALTLVVEGRECEAGCGRLMRRASWRDMEWTCVHCWSALKSQTVTGLAALFDGIRAACGAAS